VFTLAISFSGGGISIGGHIGGLIGGAAGAFAFSSVRRSPALGTLLVAAIGAVSVVVALSVV
jgi:membrane associated rhomboid family serine protease